MIVEKKLMKREALGEIIIAATMTETGIETRTTIRKTSRNVLLGLTPHLNKRNSRNQD